MKTIRAQVLRDGQVELRFGFDPELVAFVKSVSGFRWNKTRKSWDGGQHSLAALMFAGQKENVLHVSAQWPLQAAPILISGAKTLRDYQIFGAQQMLSRSEFVLVWSPRTGKTLTAITAGASAIAVGLIQRVIVVPPAGVLSEWERQIDGQFGGMTKCALNEQPMTEARARKRKARIEHEANAAQERAKSQWEKKVAGLQKKWNEGKALQTVTPPFPDLDEVAREMREKLTAKYEKQAGAATARWAAACAAHWLFCQHDLVKPQGEGLLALADAGPFALLLDEVQAFKDWKAPRSEVMKKLAHHANCRFVWGLSGTPMRNSPEDLALFFEIFGGVGGGRWGFLGRYANAHEGEFGWTTGDPTNLDELAFRLSSISHRLTREEVAPWLPAVDRSVRLCSMSREESKRYRALEAALGKQAMAGVNGSKQEALKTLAGSTTKVKISEAIERIKFHCGVRGKRILVGAYWHETLDQLAAACEAIAGAGQFYVAKGTMPPEKRHKIADEWRADPVAKPLLVNIVSSGVGIDFSDAEGALIVEVPWVPSDAQQFEARIQDIHLGKRTSPPWIEYLLAAGTIDEDMALANLKKIAVIDTVVGAERESAALAESLRNSGVVATVDIGLANQSDGAVEAALEGLRRRLAGVGDDGGGADEISKLAGDVAEAFDDEEEEDKNDADLGGE